MQLKRTESFDLAYRFITETNLNVFLTGKAGTGKTTFLKYLRENSFKKMLVAAPTGVAAINAGGVTLHSLFQLPFAPFIPSVEINATTVNKDSLLSQIRFNREKLNLLRNVELLVIDETSMVPSHTVDAIDTLLRSIKRRRQLPFGGTQVLFIGDLHQLQPVVKNQEWEFLKSYYRSIFFYDSVVLRENIPVMIELKEIFRQQDNAFIELLNGVRNNNLTKEDFDLLNSRLNRNFNPAEQEGYITLTTHNAQSDEINKKKLQKLSAKSHKYKAEVHDDFPEHLYPAEENLELKERAQIMFLKNDTEEKKNFNGKIGIVTSLSEDKIKVKCKGEDKEIEVKKYEWKNLNYSLNPDTREIIEHELGSFIQYPLRLAWAITIHKSQGLTFEKLIIDAENAFANGQVYVALSRCTSLEGLVLTSPINRSFLGAHESLKEWQEKNQDDNNLPKKFSESRQKYSLLELQNIFTWKNWYYELRELTGAINEHKENLPESATAWLTEINDKQKSLYEISLKFNEQLLNLYNENCAVEENQNLQKRIKEASNYFSAEITKWKETLLNHKLSTDIKKASRKIDSALTEINFIIHEMLHKINFCKQGFVLNDYLRSGKKLSESVQVIQSIYAQNQTKGIATGDTEHAELYDELAQMRKRIANENGIALFQVFSNETIKNICANLPADKKSLNNVRGFGKTKVNQFGDEVLSLVREYCNQKNISPRHISEKERKKKEKKEDKGSGFYNSRTEVF